jgi:general secretion pathway protein G
MSKLRGNKGFTLIEVIVVAAIIAILAGILVPMIFNQIDESKITRAQGDAKAIATAVQLYRTHTGMWPTYDPTNANPTTAYYNALFTDGNRLATVFPSDTPGDLADHLSTNAQSKALYAPGGMYEKKWKGPYMTTFPADPWGNAYVVNVWNANDTDFVWAISAGPNGKFETAQTSSAVGGDDIGVVIGDKAFKQ